MIMKALLHLFAFILIYYINLLPNINPYIFPIVCLIMLLLLEMFSHKSCLKSDGFQKRISREFIAGIIISAIYFTIVYLFRNIEVTLDGTRIVQSVMFVVYYGIVLIFVKYLSLYYKDSEEKMKFLFRVACIQGIICLAMLVIPQFKNVANNIFISSGKFAEGDYILTSRVYGISNSYTYGLPILHGLLSGICFYYGAVRDKKYFWYFPLIFMAALLNGRTGVLIAITLIIVTIFYLILKSKNKVKILLILFGVVIFLFISFAILEKVAPNIYSFMTVAFREIGNFISGGELSGTSEYLLRDKVFFPEGLDLIFGAGFRPYKLVGVDTVKTDIGFVNDLFMGGIVYITILYGSYFRLIGGCFNKKDLKGIRILLIVALLIANWKGEIFKNATFIIGLFFVILINLSDGKQNEKGRLTNASRETNISGRASE